MKMMVRVCDKCNCITWKKIDEKTRYCLFCGKQPDLEDSSMIRVIKTKDIIIKYGLGFVEKED